uniref:Uncharacterized protein n=1 Tax=Clandestinovirus TaxID=2831644 RepID=A0A8F8PQW1_9VIRU|nr:hypothetical protein KOM_12_235 [Clandestinovirus]
MSWSTEFISKCKTIALACFCIPMDQDSETSDYTTIDDHPIIPPKASGSHILVYLGPDMATHKECYDSSDDVKRRLDTLKANRWFSTYRINYA